MAANYSPCITRRLCEVARGILNQSSRVGGDGINGIDLLVFYDVPRGITRKEIARFIFSNDIRSKFSFCDKPYRNGVAIHMEFREQIPMKRGCRDIVLMFEDVLSKRCLDRVVYGRESLILAFATKEYTPPLPSAGTHSSKTPAANVMEEEGVPLPLNAFELLNLDEAEVEEVEDEQEPELLDDRPTMSLLEQIASIKARKAPVDVKLERTVERIERYGLGFLMVKCDCQAKGKELVLYERM